MKTFREFLVESKKVPGHVVPGVNKSYFVKDETESKLFDFTASGAKTSGQVWPGRTRSKNEKWAIAFYSDDFGTEAKLKSFDTKEAAKAEYDKIKDNIEYDNVLKNTQIGKSTKGQIF